MFPTNHGLYVLDVWDFPEKLDSDRENYFSEIQGAIMMFDVTSFDTYTSIPRWHAKLLKKSPIVKVVMCGSKVDCSERKVKPKNIKYHFRKNIQYYDLGKE